MKKKENERNRFMRLLWKRKIGQLIIFLYQMHQCQMQVHHILEWVVEWHHKHPLDYHNGQIIKQWHLYHRKNLQVHHQDPHQVRFWDYSQFWTWFLAKKNYKRPKATNVQSKLLEIAGQAAPDPTPEPEEKKNAPPPPPGIPPTGNCLKFSTHIRIYKK